MTGNQSNRSIKALNWLNFSTSVVATGISSFLVVYLSANLHWTASSIGIAISAMSFATVIFQSPAGYFIDKTMYKRAVIIIPSLLIAVAALCIQFFPVFPLILAARIVMGIGAACYIPGLIALAQGLASKDGFDKTISRNQAYNHAGNVVFTVLIGIICNYTNNQGLFYSYAAISILCILSTLLIKARDLRPAAHNTDAPKNAPGTKKTMLHNRPFLVFLAAAFIFNFANAGMLPLIGQQISKTMPGNASLYMSACIVISQLVMIPVAYWCGLDIHKGRKKLLIIAFVALPVRGLLYLFGSHPAYILSLQVLDGIAAGVFGVVSVLVIADLAEGSGRTNFAQGIFATAVGLGVSLSNLACGFILQASGFHTCFVLLAILAFVALIVLLTAMPETFAKTAKEA